MRLFYLLLICITVASMPSIPLFVQNIRRSLYLEKQILLFPSNSTGDIIELLNNIDWFTSSSANTIICCDESISIKPNVTNELVIIIVDGDFSTIRSTMHCAARLLSNHNRLNYCVVFSKQPVGNTLENLFRWCWAHYILNVLVIYQNQNTAEIMQFTYSPFGDFHIIQLNSQNEFFPDKLQNLHRYSIRFDVDPFLRSDDCENKRVGRNLKLLYLITDRLNAEPILVDNEKSDFYIPLSLTLHSENIQEMLYPLIMEKQLLVVPGAVAIPQYMNYFLAFKPTLWLACGASLISILIARYSINAQKRISFFTEIVHLVQLLANSPAAINFDNMEPMEIGLIAAWSFAGVIITNAYMSALNSMAIHPFSKQQINSFEDIEASGLRILVSSRLNKSQLYNMHLLPSRLNHLYEVVTPEDYYNTIFKLNTSYCYVASIMWASLKMARQQHLGLQSYYIFKDSFKFSFLMYMVPANSVYTERFNELIMDTFGSGLYYKWMADNYDEFDRCKYFNDDQTGFGKVSHPVCLKMEDLVGAFMFFGAGLMLAIVIFVIEILFRYYIMHR